MRAPPPLPSPPAAPLVAPSGARALVGISGWSYAPWRESFYPKGLPRRLELAYASRAVASIELNGSFYALQRPASYGAWRDETPPGFVFSLKGSQFITHMLRLRGVEGALANFFASGPLLLGEKLGPVLWQLPRSLAFDPALLERFLALLPRTVGAAAELARARRDARLKIDPALEPRAADGRPILHALEVRHPSFLAPAFPALLRRHGVASVVSDSAGEFPRIEDVTAPFVYARLHGAEVLYASGYGPAALAEWAALVRAWLAGEAPSSPRVIDPASRREGTSRDVYLYFDNDAKVRAPFDAMALAKLLEGEAAPPPARRRAAPPRTRREDTRRAAPRPRKPEEA